VERGGPAGVFRGAGRTLMANRPGAISAGMEATAFAVTGRLVLESGLRTGAVVVSGHKIVEVRLGESREGLPETVHSASIVSAGFIDLQVNGAFGAEIGPRAEAIAHLASRLPATGVTAFLPTLVSSDADLYPRVAEAFAASRETAGARPLGLHLEGPFLSRARSGAHRLDAIGHAPPTLYDDLLGQDVVRLVTLAPEIDGARERIARLRANGIAVSLGHTDASYDELRRGIDAGASMVTHLYNAMSGFGHRAPGAVGAALVDDRVAVGLIADGVHSHPAAVRLAVLAKRAERIALVTDAIAGAGMEPGVYALDGQDILVDETGARLANGKLAGSVLTLDRAVRNVMAWAGSAVDEACRMASEVPARVLGLAAKGRLLAGMDADLVLLDEQLLVQATFREGRRVYGGMAPGDERRAS
jgi:N-acetylglucosamine-6-phosphate deacetylase